MDMLFESTFFQGPTWTWVLLPLLIFFARIVDVTIGTMRFIFVSRGYKGIAPILGFFEVLIWLIAIGQIINNLANIMSYVAYGAGFAAGNFLGMYIEEKLSIGNVMIRLITRKDSTALIDFFKGNNIGFTYINAHGATGDVRVIFTTVPKKDLRKIISEIKRFNPNAFFTVDDVKQVNEGIFPTKFPYHNKKLLGRFFRKGK